MKARRRVYADNAGTTALSVLPPVVEKLGAMLPIWKDKLNGKS